MEAVDIGATAFPEDATEASDDTKHSIACSGLIQIARKWWSRGAGEQAMLSGGTIKGRRGSYRSTSTRLPWKQVREHRINFVCLTLRSGQDETSDPTLYRPA